MMELKRVDEREWRIVEDECVVQTMDLFHQALDLWEQGKMEVFETMLRGILYACPGHVDALHHLALIAFNEERLLEAYLLERHAVGMVFDALPEEFDPENHRIPWHHLENRPLLRAVAGMGYFLSSMDELEAGLECYRQALGLDPDDHQGVRGVILECLFALDRFEEVLEVCGLYPEDQLCEVLFARPLALFVMDRRNEADKALKEALDSRPLVGKELLKKRHSRPASMEEGIITVGGADEAYEYWERFGDIWEETPGALDWLREHAPVKPGDRKKKAAPKKKK